MASRITRLRGSEVEQSHEFEDSDETQAPPDFNLEEHREEEEFANLNGISDGHGNPTCNLVLTPNALWFDDNSVVQVITDGIQAYYDAPYTCWKNSSDVAKEQWWRFFRDKFKWLSRHSHEVKTEYKKKAAHRLKDMVNKASKVPDHKTIIWLSTEMRQRLKAVRSTTEFKKRSKQYLQNRMGGPKAGTKHCQGSISSMKIAKQMMKDSGVLPTASQLFLRTHQRPKDKSFSDPRAESLHTIFENDVAAAQANGLVSVSAMNDIFIKTSGGFTRQGSVYGVGNSVGLFYKRPSAASKTLSQPECTPSVVSQLELQLKATTGELDATKKLLAEQKRKTDEHEKGLVNQKKLIEGLYASLAEISQTMHRCGPSQFTNEA